MIGWRPLPRFRRAELQALVEAIEQLRRISVENANISVGISGISVLARRAPKPFMRPGSDAEVIPVRLKKVGGNPGSGTDACTFEYDAWRIADYDQSDAKLIDKQQPLQKRTSVGRYDPAEDGSYGIAILVLEEQEGQLTPVWKLAIALGERPAVMVCPQE